MGKTGVLLINLGTPDDPSVTSVRRYLREFLLDPRVINLPAVLRWLLIYAVILPFRSRRSADVYRQIWTANGSPLRQHTIDLAKAVGERLGTSYHVVSAMRYGKPSIAAAITQLQSCQRVIVLPLFPQYSSAATGSAIERVLRDYATQSHIPQLTIINNFYQERHFINAYVQLITPFVRTSDTFLLFSYHGLPEHQINKGACDPHCDHKQACSMMSEQNVRCYRAQCYHTSKAIASALQLSPSRYTTSFQSRLGHIPWIKPYTDQQLIELHRQGVKHLVVACPSFVADCLETLEEIGMQLRSQWQALGGNDFTLAPCLNTNATWVNAVAKLVRQHAE